MDVEAAENLARVQRLYEALGRADADGMSGELSDDAFVSFSGAHAGVPWHVGARGLDQIPRFVRSLAGMLSFERFEIVARLASARHVALRVHVRYRVHCTGRVVDQHQVHWLTLANGKITALEHFEDTALVAWAAGALDRRSTENTGCATPAVE